MSKMGNLRDEGRLGRRELSRILLIEASGEQTGNKPSGWDDICPKANNGCPGARDPHVFYGVCSKGVGSYTYCNHYDADGRQR